MAPAAYWRLPIAVSTAVSGQSPFKSPAVEAEEWFYHLQFECKRRGWGDVGMSQLQSRENSGSLILLDGVVEQVSVVWERSRGKALHVRARPVVELDFAEAHDCFQRTNEWSSARAMERHYRWGILEYQGHAWHGELWLDDDLCLGPPSKQNEEISPGPCAVIVDAVVDCISAGHLTVVFGQLLDELAAFLAVVVNTSFHVARQRQVWTWALTAEGTDCSVSQLGYVETVSRLGMPTRGMYPPIPLASTDVTKPEIAVPQDLVDLWEKYRTLTVKRREQFLSAASKLQEARLLYDEWRWTVGFALMVVACEVLKPAGPLYDEHNIYDVVTALLGKEISERLQTLFDQKIDPGLHPQSIRSAHLHRGEFYGSEFARGVMMSNFRDPTFREATSELLKITRAAIAASARRPPRRDRREPPDPVHP
jgi:hypothetical protein